MKLRKLATVAIVAIATATMMAGLLTDVAALAFGTSGSGSGAGGASGSDVLATVCAGATSVRASVVTMSIRISVTGFP